MMILLVIIFYMNLSFQVCKADLILTSELEQACSRGDLYRTHRFLSTTNFSDSSSSDKARVLHALNALEVILYSNLTWMTIARHREAKSFDPTIVPPMAQFYMNGRGCGGISDLFYVSAVLLKQVVDKCASIDTNELEKHKESINLDLDALQTLITLTSDSGLQAASEEHFKKAINKTGSSSATFRFRGALMTPGVFVSLDEVLATRKRLRDRVEALHSPPALKLLGLDEFTLSPTFYFIYQGYNDRFLLEKLHKAYAVASPELVQVQDGVLPYRTDKDAQTGTPITSTSAVATTAAASYRPYRIGFVSSHFRRHSICKLFCDIILGLAQDERFEIFVFSALAEDKEDDSTKALRRQADSPKSRLTFVPIQRTLIKNRAEVASRGVDVLVYLDVGMDPSTTAWAAARLAPVQVCIWGHPSTTGLAAMDYYISSAGYHAATTVTGRQERHSRGDLPYSEAMDGEFSFDAQSHFTEQLVLFDSLGFAFKRPKLFSSMKKKQSDALLVRRDSAFFHALAQSLPPVSPVSSVPPPASDKAPTKGAKALAELVHRKASDRNLRILLCPQHLPKFHPEFDDVLLALVTRHPHALVAIIDSEKKLQWRRTLEARWSASAAAAAGDAILERFLWIPSLNPQEYLALLSIGDVMLDPFPFGGGVTTLEALAVYTPTVTFPHAQNVPQLAAGMIDSLGLAETSRRLLVVDSPSAYIESVLALIPIASAENEATDLLVSIREELRALTPSLYNGTAAVRDWAAFLFNSVETISAAEAPRE